jgi:hypothetical protein
MSKQKFRFFLILNWLLIVAYSVVSMTTESLLPPEIISYLDAQADSFNTTDIVLIIVGVVYLMYYYIVLYVGIFLFKKWAKTLLLPSYVISSLLVLLFFNNEPMIETGWASFLGDIISLVEGIILVLVYLSPISRVFEINRHTTR